MASPLRFLATRAFSNIASSAPATTSPLQQLLMVPKHHPLKFGMGFSLCKTSLSDLIAQTFLEKKEKIDWKRNAAFATFGEREFYSSFVFFLSGYDSLSRSQASPFSFPLGLLLHSPASSVRAHRP
jgi:hypothetical protein